MDVRQEAVERKYEELAPFGASLVEKAEAMVIKDDNAYTGAAEIGREAARRMKVVKEEFDEPKTLANKAHKAISALERKLLDPLERVKIACNKKMGQYSLDKEREAMRLEDIRRAKEAEKAREEAEARAVELEQAGDDEGATAVIEEAVQPDFGATAQPIEKAPKQEGVSHRTTFKWRYTDKKLVPAEFWVIDEKRITDRVNSMKGEANIKGVQVYEERTTAFR